MIRAIETGGEHDLTLAVHVGEGADAGALLRHRETPAYHIE